MAAITCPTCRGEGYEVDGVDPDGTVYKSSCWRCRGEGTLSSDPQAQPCSRCGAQKGQPCISETRGTPTRRWVHEERCT